MIDPYITRQYALHGLSIEVSSNHPGISAALQTRLKRLLASEPGPGDLRFKFSVIGENGIRAPSTPSGQARLLFEWEGTKGLYYNSGDKLYIEGREKLRALCDIGRGIAEVSIREDAGDAALWISRMMFMVCLGELLKRSRKYFLHVASLCLNGRGFLLAGGSGSGKSTLSIALLRAGFDLLGDDIVFLSQDRQGINALAFPEGIDATDETVSLFPELNHLLNQAKPPGRSKHQIWPEEAYSSEAVWECSPRILIFPKKADGRESVLRPMDRYDAFMELLPNVLFTETRSTQAHVDALGELVRTCGCYRLETGRDFDRIPHLLRELVD